MTVAGIRPEGARRMPHQRRPRASCLAAFCLAIAERLEVMPRIGRADMPTLSEFFGILIRMYWDDHPPPHFHALYGEYEALYNIATLECSLAPYLVVRMRWLSNG